MPKMNRRIAALAIGLAAVSALSLEASAQSWPERTVRVIVPLPPGTAIDVSARIVAEHLSGRWAQPVAIATTSDNFLVVATSAKLNVHSLADLIKRARSSSARLN